MAARASDLVQTELNQLRAQLLATRTALLETRDERLGRVRHSGVDRLDGMDTERATGAFIESGLEVSLAEIDQESKELEAINRALAAMDEGSYGLCRKCGASIDGRRLHANPAALHCIGCETGLAHG